MLKTIPEGTRPFSPIVSIIAFTATFNKYFGATEGCVYLIFRYNMPSASHYLSPTPKELCVFIPESLN